MKTTKLAEAILSIGIGVGLFVGGTIGAIAGVKHGEKQWANGVAFGIKLKELLLTLEEINKKHQPE